MPLKSSIVMSILEFGVQSAHYYTMELQDNCAVGAKSTVRITSIDTKFCQYLRGLHLQPLHLSAHISALSLEE
jgi:hypothetical protein